MFWVILLKWKIKNEELELKVKNNAVAHGKIEYSSTENDAMCFSKDANEHAIDHMDIGYRDTILMLDCMNEMYLKEKRLC